MGEKEKGKMYEKIEKNSFEKCVAAAFKRDLERFGVVFTNLLDELSSINDRVGGIEAENAELKKRVFDAETYLVTLADRLNASELKAGMAATSKAAELSFTNVPEIEEEAAS